MLSLGHHVRPRHAPDDAPDMPHICPRHSPDDAPDMPQTRTKIAGWGGAKVKIAGRGKTARKSTDPKIR